MLQDNFIRLIALQSKDQKVEVIFSAGFHLKEIIHMDYTSINARTINRGPDSISVFIFWQVVDSFKCSKSFHKTSCVSKPFIQTMLNAIIRETHIDGPNQKWRTEKYQTTCFIGKFCLKQTQRQQ